MAFTCGPHHLDHGLHVLISGRAGGWLDLLTIAVGFPAGVMWFLLRVEAMMGGRGDRTIRGHARCGSTCSRPWASLYVTALLDRDASGRRGRRGSCRAVAPNIVLVVLYGASASCCSAPSSATTRSPAGGRCRALARPW